MKMISFKQSFLLFLVISFAFCSYAQKTKEGLDQQLAHIQRLSNIPGFAVAIVKNDSVLFMKGYGYADKKKKIAYTPETIQPAGSVSKTVIGLALMVAIDKGYFTLETPVNDILPFKVINPSFPSTLIRIKHLVTHTSSLIDDEDYYRSAYVTSEKPTVELGAFLLSYLSAGSTHYKVSNFAKAEPGKQYNYSNIASSLAAYLVEIKSQMPFSKFTSEMIFKPLRMQDSHWFYNTSMAAKYASLYEVNMQYDPLYKTLLTGDGLLKQYTNNSYPDGSLRTSIKDLSFYLRGMIRGYSGQAGVISKNGFQSLFKKQFVTPPLNNDPREPNKGIFWGYNRKNKIMHSGSDPGIAALVSFDPVTKIGRAILINTQLEGKNNILTIEAFMNILKSLDNFEQAN